MENIIEVFRLEDLSGSGPFSNLPGMRYSAVELLPNYIQSVLPRWNDAHRFPGFHTDPAFKHLSRKARLKYRFAFNSEDVLLNAFPKAELRYMYDRYGINVFRLKVDKYIQSSYQTIFKGNPVEKINISEELLAGVSIKDLIPHSQIVSVYRPPVSV